MLPVRSQNLVRTAPEDRSNIAVIPEKNWPAPLMVRKEWIATAHPIFR